MGMSDSPAEPLSDEWFLQVYLPSLALPPEESSGTFAVPKGGALTRKLTSQSVLLLNVHDILLCRLYKNSCNWWAQGSVVSGRWTHPETPQN